MPVPTTGVTVDEAKALLPPGFSISKDEERENRWRMRADGDYVGPKSKGFGKGTGLTDFEALRFLVQLAWRHQDRKHGTPCPWTWDETGDS